MDKPSEPNNGGIPDREMLPLRERLARFGRDVLTAWGGSFTGEPDYWLAVRVGIQAAEDYANSKHE